MCNTLCTYCPLDVIFFVTLSYHFVSTESYIFVTIYNPTLYQFDYDIPPGYSPGTYLGVLGHVGGSSVSKYSTSTDMSGSSILRDLDPEVAPGDLLYATLAFDIDPDTIINEIRHRTGNPIHDDTIEMRVSSNQIQSTLISSKRWIFCNVQ